MDEAAKKTALRMIPYGLFVMTVKDDKTMTGAAVNWLTQASFAPPLVVLGAKADNPSTAMIESGIIKPDQYGEPNTRPIKSSVLTSAPACAIRTAS